jgi:hypothetical protein
MAFTAPLKHYGKRHGTPKRTYVVTVDTNDGDWVEWKRPLRLAQAVRLRDRLQKSLHLRGHEVAIGQVARAV